MSNKYLKGSIGWYKDLAKETGYPEEIKDNVIGPFIKWAREKGILVDPIKIHRQNTKKILENSGCKTGKEYRDRCAQKLGFKNRADRIREPTKEYYHQTGRSLPVEFNENCSSNFGVHIGEQVFKEYLLTIFEYAEKKDYGNSGYDFLCKNVRQEFIDKYPQFKLERYREYKVQLELRCLQYVEGKNPYWKFLIDYNRIADIFLFSGWDDRQLLQPIYSWLFHKNEKIKYGMSYSNLEYFWKRETITITNNENINRLKKYELPLQKLKDIWKNKRGELC